MIKAIKGMSALAIALVMAAGCSTAPSSSGARADLQSEARDTIAQFRQTDPTMDRFFNSSVAYAVYPSIGKGGLIAGGAYGRGVLFENGVFTNYCDLTQATIGLQIGGQEYSEIIFFENDGALSEFKNGAMTFAAQASAVAASAGVAATRDYDGGVAVFVADQDGLMAEASIGGQKFSVVSASDSAFEGDPRPDVYASPNDNNRNSNDYNRNNNNDLNNRNYNSNDLDAGWRNDSAYNRQYDASQSRVIQGQVTSLSSYAPASSGAQNGRMITVRAVDGQTYNVHLGPTSYLDRGDMLRIREGDQVTITGSSTTFDGRSVIIARDVTGSDNKRLELRDSDGRPRWNTNLENQR
jgi:lipid-binding SYLF domain-containing protein